MYIKFSRFSAFKKFVMDHFKVTSECVDLSVHKGRDDLGQWAPEAYAVIHLGHGLPHFEHPLWDAFGTDFDELYAEPVNGEVIALWKI